MNDPIPDNAFRWPVTVDESEIDGLGHASNVAVVGWISRAAWEHSKALGYGLPEYREAGGVFVVRRHEIDYRAQARIGDELICYTWPSGLAKVTAERRHRILRPADEAVIAEAYNVWAYLDMETGRPKRIPPAVRETFDPAKFDHPEA
jgi:acyl-CoA thioester hydrolase